jgi:hypothetical protein
MIIPVSTGEWMQSLWLRMDNAMEGDCFLLPTEMHLHAFNLVKETQFPGREFKVQVGSQKECV